MKIDVYIKVRFKTSEEGGRKTSLKRKIPFGVDFYACPMIIDDCFYDCRLLIGDMEIELGRYYELSVVFLDRESALQNLVAGKNISLWEGTEVATGQIVKICG